jgi:outer membrane protein TolC
MPVPRPPAGEEGGIDRNGLSPDAAALRAVLQNPRLRAIRAQRGIAGAEILTAGLLPNPRLDASLPIPITGEQARVLGFGVGVAWNVAPLVSRGNRVAAAKEAGRSLDLEIGWQEWQVAQGARLHALRVIYLLRRLEAARDVEATWQRRVAALREVLQQRAVTALEVATSERALAEARLMRAELEQTLARERVDLNEALGTPAQDEVLVDRSWRATWKPPSLAELLAQLPDRRLDLLALRAAQRSQDRALRAEVLARFPPLEIGFHVGREVEDATLAGLTLGLELPFFQRNQGNVMRARARNDQFAAEYEARLLEARAQVARLAQEAERAEPKLAMAAEAVESATRLAELGRQAALSRGLTPLAAAELTEHAAQARLRHLELEQGLAELSVALSAASGIQPVSARR